MGDDEKYGYTPLSPLRRALAGARLEKTDSTGDLLPGMVEVCKRDEGEGEERREGRCGREREEGEGEGEGARDEGGRV